jgi:hypothetical protein
MNEDLMEARLKSQKDVVESFLLQKKLEKRSVVSSWNI